MDIVPYISKVETALRNKGGLKNNNIRSADGKYSVIQGGEAEFITVTGFNLNPAAAGVRVLNQTQQGAYNPTAAAAGTQLTITGITANYTGFKASNDSTKSGYLTVYTNGIGTLNNINNNDSAGAYVLTSSANGLDQENMPNREADRYTTKNIRLSDDRYLQFYTVKKTDVKNGYYPVMLMNGNNPVFGYLDLTGGPDTAPVVGAGGGAGSYFPSHAMPQRAEFSLTGGTNYKEYLIKASIWDAMGMARDDSGRYIHATTYNRDGAALHLVYDRYAELYTTNATYGGIPYPDPGSGWGSGIGYSNYAGNWAYDNSNNAIALETVNLDGLLLERYQYPRLIAKGDSTSSTGASYYMAYYDDGVGQLIFRNFRIGSTSGSVGTSHRRLSSTGSDAAGTPYGQPYTSITENPDTGGTGTGNTTWRTGRLPVAGDVIEENPSKYFDLAVSSGNIVVIAYYDEADGQLKIKYSNTAVTGTDPTAAINWNNSPVNLPDYTGTYVSMVMDASNGIHIAAFDAVDSDLKYIYVPDYTQAAYTAKTVDQYGSVGNWTQIKLKNNVPYIAYYNATETGGRDSIKLAWAKAPVTSAADVKEGVDVNGYTTGEWEYMTVPAIDPPQGGSTKFQKVNLGFTTDGRPVLGYLATNIEFSYPVGE
jgi:hypothetical protein